MDHGLVRMVPVLGGRELAPMVAFYERFGLHVTAEFHGYVIMATREAYDPERPDDGGEGPGAVEIHLSQWDGHDPATVSASLYLRVRDAQGVLDRLHEELEGAGHHVTSPEVKPWGQLEWSVLDPAGHTVRVGSPAP